MESGDVNRPVREKLIVLVFLLVVLLFVFRAVLMHPTWLISPAYDMVGSYTPWKYFEHVSFQKYGQLPLWDNLVFSGTPILGDMSVSMYFNPLNMLFLLIPPEMAYGYVIMFYVLVAGFSTYLLLRLKRRSRLASLLCAVSYMLSACIFTRLMNGSMTETINTALLPLIFLAFEYMREVRSILSSVFLGLALAWLFHSAMVQYFFYTCIAVLIYFIYLFVTEVRQDGRLGRGAVRLVLLGAVSFLVCITLSAISLLPALELAGNSSRVAFINQGFASVGSMSPAHIITLFLPRFFGVMYNNTGWGTTGSWESAIYIGVIAALLGVVGLLFTLRKENGAYLWIGIFMALHALGKHTPFHGLLFRFVPGFNLFRVPGSTSFIAIFCFMVFSAYSLDFIFSRKNKRLSTGIAYTIIALGILSIIAVPIISSQRAFIEEKGMATLSGSGILQSTDAKPLEYYQSKISLIATSIIGDVLRLGLLALSMGMLILLWHKTLLNKGLLSLILLGVVLCDLVSFSMPFVWVYDPKEIFVDTPLTDFLHANLKAGEGRVFDATTSSVLPHHLSARYGLEIVSGYNPIFLSEYTKFTNLLGEYTSMSATELTYQTDRSFSLPGLKNRLVLDLLNVKYIVSDKPYELPGTKLVLRANHSLQDDYGGKEYVTQTTDVFVYENLARLPRAFIVRNAIAADGDSALLAISDPAFDPREYVVLDTKQVSDVSATNTTLNPGEFETADITYYSPNEIVAEADMETPGYLVMSEIYYPAWKAYDNGKKTEILKADYALRAVYLTEGAHKIDYRYEPESYKMGRIISISSLILIVFFIGWVLAWKKNI